MLRTQNLEDEEESKYLDAHVQHTTSALSALHDALRETGKVAFQTFLAALGDYKQSIIPKRFFKQFDQSVGGYFPTITSLTKHFMVQFKMYVTDGNKTRWKKVDSQILVWVSYKLLELCTDGDLHCIDRIDPTPDQWNLIAKILELDVQCVKKQWARIQVRVARRQGVWTDKEKRIVEECLKSPVTQKVWKQISDRIFTECGRYRSSKQVREYYHNHLDTTLTNTVWTAQEDERLMRLVREEGRKWSSISTKLPGRNYNQVKNRYLHLLSVEQGIVKRRYTRRAQSASAAPTDTAQGRKGSDYDGHRDAQNEQIESEYKYYDEDDEDEEQDDDDDDDDDDEDKNDEAGGGGIEEEEGGICEIVLQSTKLQNRRSDSIEDARALVRVQTGMPERRRTREAVRAMPQRRAGNTRRTSDSSSSESPPRTHGGTETSDSRKKPSTSVIEVVPPPFQSIGSGDRERLVRIQCEYSRKHRNQTQ